MGLQTLTIEIDADTVALLARSASARSMSVEQVAAEAIAAHALEQARPLHDWSAEYLAAIQDGFEQLDRGEGVRQDVVEREIADLLRS
jgi:predicted transcriptional regulator